jgi:hypothetical protein
VQTKSWYEIQAVITDYDLYDKSIELMYRTELDDYNLINS